MSIDKYKNYLEKTKETGIVKKVFHPVVYVEGLPSVAVDEIIYFDTGEEGVVTATDVDYVEILSLSENPVVIDSHVTRSGEFLQVPVGEGLLGKAISPLGKPIYEDILLTDLEETRPLDILASGISTREKVTEAFETGVTSVDLMIPLGKGQRELIIGDRKIGKTEFLFQTLLNQARKGTIVIYAAIGKKRTSIKQIGEFADKMNITDKMVTVASSASDSLGNIYLTPYAAMTIAEYFRDKGQDTLVIFDDLTTHAKYYREVSLIARKFPGRESYPGDIFYAHARLLERGGLFKVGKSKVAITCLPVAETVEGDISGYIQTNLMSITDGHIFFDSDLFKQGRKPAVNHFFSVTRVGRQTQSKLRWGVNRELVSFFTLLNKTQNFVHFGAELNEGIKSTLQMGDKLINFFNQPIKEVIPVKIQILFYCLVWVGIFNTEDLEKVRDLMVTSARKYGTDSEFTKKMDNLIKEEEEFNTLLGKISGQAKNLVSYIEGLHEEKQEA